MSESRVDPKSPDEQAAVWFARRQGEAFGAHDETELQAWLTADPAHAEAYADLQLLWQDMAQLSWSHVSAERPAPRRRWRSLATAACLALLALLPAWLDVPPGVRLTLVSGPLTPGVVTLEDGSRIHLNRNTRLEVRLLADRREVELVQGQAFFEVARDVQRPFEVQAGEGSVQVLGTRFDVRRGRELLVVSVESGRVALQPRADTSAVELLSGDRAVYDGSRGTLLRSRVADGDVASWRSGWLVFRQWPLTQVFDELSLYGATSVSFGDAALAARQVSGSVDLARPDDFLSALPLLLPVKIEPQEDGSVRLINVSD